MINFFYYFILHINKKMILKYLNFESYEYFFYKSLQFLFNLIDNHNSVINKYTMNVSCLPILRRSISLHYMVAFFNIQIFIQREVYYNALKFF